MSRSGTVGRAWGKWSNMHTLGSGDKRKKINIQQSDLLQVTRERKQTRHLPVLGANAKTVVGSAIRNATYHVTSVTASSPPPPDKVKCSGNNWQFTHFVRGNIDMCEEEKCFLFFRFFILTRDTISRWMFWILYLLLLSPSKFAIWPLRSRVWRTFPSLVGYISPFKFVSR